MDMVGHPVDDADETTEFRQFLSNEAVNLILHIGSDERFLIVRRPDGMYPDFVE